MASAAPPATALRPPATRWRSRSPVVTVNLEAARAGYKYAARFQPFAAQLQPTSQQWALVTGNEVMAMGTALAGCKFYCAYVARGFSGQPKHLATLYAEGIRDPGFALIDLFSPCVTFNKQNTYDWFRKRVYTLEDARHDPTDFHAAMDAALECGAKIPIGLFYRDPNPRPTSAPTILNFRPASRSIRRCE